MNDNTGGKSIDAFGYWFTPNGCMNKAFGDPDPGTVHSCIVTQSLTAANHRPGQGTGSELLLADTSHELLSQ